MITRIEVDGFKSLRGFALDLEPFTAVVGANSAGKSNLFDALQLLSRLTEMRLVSALKAGRGHILDQFSRTEGDVERRMSFAVELLFKSADEGARRQTRARYEVEIQRFALPSGVELLDFASERLVSMHQADDAWMSRHPALAHAALYEDEGVSIAREPPVSLSEIDYRRFTVSYENENVHESRMIKSGQSVMSLGGLSVSPLLDDVAAELRSFRFAHLEPSKLRLASERAAGVTLAPDGANLPTALAALSPEARAEIRADLADLVPGVRTFEVVPVEEDQLRIEVELTDGQRLPARVLSDGTLRLLALFTMLQSSPEGGLIAMEEPENGIYPGRLRALVEKLVGVTARSGGVPRQVLLNSHSPAIVAALHAKPESLVFADVVRRRDGLRSTRMRGVRGEGGSDRGATTVSPREIDRILEAARPEDEV